LDHIARLTRDGLAAAVSRLGVDDPRLAAIVARHGPPPLWARPTGYRTLARVILEQQVSLKSAASLFARLDREVRGGIEAGNVERAGVRKLRALGVTRQKSDYLVSLARSVRDGTLDLAAIGRLGDEEAREALVAVRGIGPWTAGVYLLMCLRRPDIWPAGDLALHIALARLRGRSTLPSSREAERYAERWRPWRAVAARILWHGYLAERDSRGDRR
jgi:DNA-3-methyladenine glycosylase II